MKRLLYFGILFFVVVSCLNIAFKANGSEDEPIEVTASTMDIKHEFPLIEVEEETWLNSDIRVNDFPIGRSFVVYIPVKSPGESLILDNVWVESEDAIAEQDYILGGKGAIIVDSTGDGFFLVEMAIVDDDEKESAEMFHIYARTEDSLYRQTIMIIDND